MPLRRMAGWAIAVTGAFILSAQLAGEVTQALRASPSLAAGVAASALAGAATGLGAAAILLLPPLTDRGRAVLLGFSAGVMLAAAVLSLLLPAIDAARTAGASPVMAAAWVAGAALLGAMAIRAADRALPHRHPDVAEPAGKLWLVVAAIALHNLPEGFAVGAGFGGGGELGASTALAIAVQNVPEGLVVAAALAILGFGAAAAVLLATLTGLAEPVGALIGGAASGVAEMALPLALAGAAGAMLFVVIHELLPAAVRSGHGRPAAGATAIGAGVMAALGAML